MYLNKFRENKGARGDFSSGSQGQSMNTFSLFQRVIAVCSFILCMFAGTAVQAKDKTALLFIPLDNRPVCFSYPVKVMEAAGYKIWL